MLALLAWGMVLLRDDYDSADQLTQERRVQPAREPTRRAARQRVRRQGTPSPAATRASPTAKRSSERLEGVEFGQKGRLLPVGQARVGRPVDLTSLHVPSLQALGSRNGSADRARNESC